jgi:cbb3-type cytochrome oxidase subunit 3
VKSELLARSPLLALPLIALFIFLTVFAVMFFLTMRKRSVAYDPLARMPLDDDSNEDKGAGR